MKSVLWSGLKYPVYLIANKSIDVVSASDKRHCVDEGLLGYFAALTDWKAETVSVVGKLML